MVRRPARPCWSIDICHDRNSSTVSVYRLQASSRERSPPRTAATTSALRRITHRRVDVGGRSAIVSGLPSGPMTYLTLARCGSVIKYSQTQTRLHRRYGLQFNICLSVHQRDCVKYCASWRCLFQNDAKTDQSVTATGLAGLSNARPARRRRCFAPPAPSSFEGWQSNRVASYRCGSRERLVRAPRDR